MKHILVFFCSMLTAFQASAQFTPPVVIAHSPFYEYHHRPYDWDHDGDLDYIGEYEHTILHLYENTGGGHLLNPVVIDTFPFNWNLLYAAEFADLNEDGLTDIIFAVYPSEMLVCLQMEGGAFAIPVSIPVTGVYSDTELVDMNGDGFLDLLVMAGDLHWFENDRTGNFSLLHVFENLTQQLIHITDVNGDTRPDIFLFTSTSDSLLLLYNNGPDDFLVINVNFEPSYYLSSLISVDLDGDGLPDLLPGSSNRPDSRWSRNLGGAYFGPMEPLDPTATWVHWPQGSQNSTGDIDLDGDIDVISKGVDTIVWFENTGNAVFTTHLLGTGLSVIGMNAPYVHDWNEDGLPDIVFTKSASAVAYYPNLGGNQFGPMVFIAPEVINASIIPADIDGDGLLDLWIKANPDYRVGWQRNLGNGQWSARQNIELEEYYFTYLIPGDLDNDGDSDLLVGRQDADGGGPPYEHALTRYENLGNGQFAPSETLALLPYIAAWVADIDMDGDNDIVTMADGPAPSGVWMPNDGAGHFGAQVFFDPGSDTSSVLHVTDLDRDGDPDLLVQLTNGQAWYANDGAGFFEGPYLLSSNVPYYTFLDAADMDNDSFPDLVYQISGDLVWSRNPGDGGMVGPPQRFFPEEEQTYYTHSVKLADLNSDGKTDVLLMFEDRAYGWVPNLGNGVFGERIILGAYTNDYYISFQSADLDGDGGQEFLYTQTYEFGYYNDFSGLPDVRGHCYVDENANGQQDAGEPDLPGIGVSLDPSPTISQTNADGAFRYFALPGQYTLGFQYDSCWVLTTDSAALHISLPLPIDTILGFGFRPNLDFTDVKTVVTSGQPVCGQTVPFWLVLRNDGCQPANTRYRFELDSLLTWVWAVPGPSGIFGDTIYWNSLPPLEPGETRNIVAYITMAPAIAGDVPVVAGIAETLDANGSTVLHSDTFYYSVPVLCSYDPNDKLVNVSELPPNYTSDSSLLTYTIRFQNTGNFMAFNIRVRDTLDAVLDWNSFEPLAASHSYFSTLDTASGVAQFDFLDIRLADSTSNELQSHGFITFSIRLKPGLSPGSFTRNRAGIYFDVNAPVITNWAETKVRELVSTHSTPAIPAIRIAPNPVADILTVFFSDKPVTDARVQVYDLRGQMVLEKNVPDGLEACTLDVSALPAAAYLLKIRGKDRTMGQAFFVKI